MFKAADLKRALDRALDSPAATAAAMVALLAMPVLASSGATGTESGEAPRSGAYLQPFEGAYNYQMRCWQHGRLVFEQNLVELPPATPGYALRESGSDRDGRPVYVAETASSATCLIRGVADAGAPMPH